MTTREAAEYLRLKERKLYELVAEQRIPCTKATGKWLFPKDLIDQWLLSQVQGDIPSQTVPPKVVVGSHDPLLEWALRASGAAYSVLFDGSLDGLDRFLRGEASFCGMHALDAESGLYNTPLIERRAKQLPLVVLQWAHRRQGLILPADNPYGVNDLVSALRLRWAVRQQGAGSYLLLKNLLRDVCAEETFDWRGSMTYRSEMALASAVANREVDVGLGVQAAAHTMGLHFIPLVSERYDLVVWRKVFFGESFQHFWRFVNGVGFRQQASRLSGYDVKGLGEVFFNGN